MSMQQERGMLQAVVVSVCLPPAIADQIADAFGRMPWLIDVSHLDSYSSATRRPAFGPQMKAADAGFAFIDFTQNVDQAIDCTRYLVQTFGAKLTVVAVGENDRPELILEAMRAGCSEYMSAPFSGVVLTDTLRRISQRWMGNFAQAGQEGSVVALFGAKGGVGTTTLAVHLACYLKQYKKKVLLIDSQPELGHACIYLGLDGAPFTFAEVVRNVNRLDSDLLQGFVAKHSSGLAVLSSPDHSGSTRPLEPTAVAKTLDFLRSEYDYVIVDCDRSFSDLTRTVIEAAARIYLVATPEVCAIRDLSRYIDRILQSSESAEHLHVVLNRFTAQSGLDVARIEKAIRLSINIRIPNNYPALVKSGNLGELLPADSKIDVAQEIKRWVATLVQVPQSAASTKAARSLNWPTWGKRPTAALRKGAIA